MQKLRLTRAVEIALRTTPYIGYRALLCLGVLCLAAVDLIVMLMVGATFGPAAFWALVAVQGLAFVYLYLRGVFDFDFVRGVRTGHAALLAAVARGDAPSGGYQVPWARDRVRHRLGDDVQMLQMEGLVLGALLGMNARLFGNRYFPPKPAMKLVKEAVLGHALTVDDPNVWGAARDGIGLYHRSAQSLASSAMLTTGLEWCAMIAAMVAFMVPLGVLSALLDSFPLLRFALFLCALLLGWALKAIVLEPVASASVMLTFLEEADVPPPPPGWEQGQDAANPALAEVAARAREAGYPSQGAPAAQ